MVAIAIALFVVFVAYPISKNIVKDRISIDIKSIEIDEITLLKMAVNLHLEVENHNEIGIKLDSIRYDIYFEDDGEWVFLTQGEGGPIDIESNQSADFELVNSISNRKLIKIGLNLIRDLSLDMPTMKIAGTAWYKLGPFTLGDSFEEVFNDIVF